MTYTVKKGDTLSAIAMKHGTTIKAIADLNKIENVNMIYPGQNLTIPEKSVDWAKFGKAVRDCMEDIQSLPSFAKIMELMVDD